MSGIFLTNDFDVIAEQLKYYSISVDVYKELKEPILYSKNDVLLFNKYGMLLFNDSKLKILYINTKYRKKGKGSEFIIKMESVLKEKSINVINALIPTDKLEFYTKNGFVEISRFVNYIKVKKEL